MPGSKKSRYARTRGPRSSRHSKKRFHRRRTHSRRRKRSVITKKLHGLGGSPFGRHIYTKFSFDHTIFLSGQSGHVKYQAYRLNSLYDPNYTSSNVLDLQPRYFDTLLGAGGNDKPYHDYYVYGAKVSVLITNGNSHTPLAVGIVAYDVANGGPSTDLTQARARADTTVLNISGYNGSKGAKKYKKYFRIGRLLGESAMDEDNKGMYNSNPAKSILMEVRGWDAFAGFGDGSHVTSTNFYITTKITYYCKLTGRNNVANS